METVIIDAYNLMHKVSELRLLLKQPQDLAVDTMVSKFEGHFFGRVMKVVLVFDGMGKNKHERNIEVKFAKTGVGPDWGNADTLIKHLIEKSKNPKLVRVVSSDRDITLFAKECGSKIQTAEGFWGEVKDKRFERAEILRESKEKPNVVTKTEFDFLLKEFTKK